MKIRLMFLCATLLAITMSVGRAHAAVPTTLTQQGRVFDASGTPLSTTLNVVFALYAASSGGASVWSETQSLTFDSGYFSTQLGSVTPFGAGVWAGEALYLGVTVGADPEMTPREEITSVPYALLANDVNGDIHPSSISVGGQTVVNNQGQWVGPIALAPATPLASGVLAFGSLAGGIGKGTTYTFAHNSPGSYTITFPGINLTTAPDPLIVTSNSCCTGAGPNVVVENYSTLSPLTWTVHIYNLAGTLEDHDFSFVLFPGGS